MSLPSNGKAKIEIPVPTQGFLGTQRSYFLYPREMKKIRGREPRNSGVARMAVEHP
jgi:hypothetical protein